jgi:hypothetical protein
MTHHVHGNFLAGIISPSSVTPPRYLYFKYVVTIATAMITATATAVRAPHLTTGKSGVSYFHSTTGQPAALASLNTAYLFARS